MSKVREKRVWKCILHLESVSKEGAEPFTKIRWDKCREAASEWVNLDGIDKTIADFFSTNNLRSTEFDDLPPDNDLGFHPTCYRRFTDKTKIQRAKVRCENRERASVVSTPSGSGISKGKSVAHSPPTPPSLISPKKLRSHHGPVLSRTIAQPRKHVLPEVCIICKKRSKYIKSSGTFKREKLVICETITADKLLKAASEKKDESILLHIRGQDCVALEVKYHAQCYRNYTRSLQTNVSAEDSDVPISEKVYKEFCDDVVQKRLIDNLEILRMKRLAEIFNDISKRNDGEDAVVMRTDVLKRKLRRDFSQLTFYSQPRKNLSELVYVENLPAGKLVETIPSSSTDTEISSTDSSDSLQTKRIFDINPKKTLYDAALLIREALKNKSGMEGMWPPTADTLNLETAKTIVPVELYNFLAWITCVSEEPDICEFVDVSEESHTKLLSLCQDIIYFASNGRKQTPKSLTLGLVTRHLTGSSQLLRILNKFGHSTSASTTIGFETSLAELQLSTQDKVPQGFLCYQPTILVWDNIDFGEETLSGKGTTHHTNGIMIQNHQLFGEPSSRTSSLPKGHRSLKPVPTTMVEYSATKRHGPQDIISDISLDEKLYFRNLHSTFKIDLAFVILKYYTSGYEEHLPGWTGFNCQTDSLILPKSKIHYMPVIEASPTEMTTVNTILVKSLDVADKLKLQHILLVFDQAIYAKAQQIRWKDANFTKRIVIRLGEFHTCMTFLGVLGKVYKDAGLQDILIESEVVAAGSINGVINGHQYNRSIRSHKLLFEALQRLRFEAFLESLSEVDLNTAQDFMHELECSFQNDTILLDIPNSSNFDELRKKYEHFIIVNSASNQTFALWSNYIDMVQILLCFIRATRQSNWMLHLDSLRCMMPWFFAYDRINYARYGCVYWMEMMRLPTSHPQLHKDSFETGKWTVQRQDNNSFSAIACDQAIEQTLNRDSKTKGGITGMTLERGAVQRWVLAQPHRAAITRQCEEMTGINSSSRTRKDLDKSRIKKDEEAVNSIISTIQSMINPFDTHQEGIVCISSGFMASPDIAKDLLDAKQRGSDALDTFINNRLVSKTEDYFAPIKSMKLKTFSDLSRVKKPKKQSVSDLSTGSKGDGRFFQRLLVISQNRDLNLRDILKHSLGPVSFPLANSGGSLAKTNKSVLLGLLEKKFDTSIVDTVEGDSVALIIDGMAIVQGIVHVPGTFGELADQIFIQIINLAKKYNCSRIDFVCDRYPEISIKNPERQRRAVTGIQRIKIYSKDQRTPKQWKKFLSSGENKEEFIEFLFSTWRNIDGTSFDRNLSIFIAHGSECHSLEISDGISSLKVIPELKTDHEEADTRLFLHAKHASSLHNSVIIKSPDTDVAIIAVGLQNQISANIYFLTGTKNKLRMIDVQIMSNALGPKESDAIIGLHCFSGCDSTSAFYGKGKKRVFDLTMKKDKYVELMSKLGNSLDVEVIKTYLFEIEQFVCDLYGVNVQTVDEARFKLFCTKSASEQCLPPTSDALMQHLLRVCYQAAVCKKSLAQWMVMPSPNNFGWQIKEGSLDIVWMTRDPVPKPLLDLTQCSCKSGCNSGRCVCCKSKLACTIMCKCVACQNEQSENELQSEEEEVDSDSDNE